MKKRLFGLMVFSILFAAAQIAANAQTTGSIAGTITDSNGAVVPSATVVVRNVGNGQEFTSATVENGTYRIPAVPNGFYTVDVSAAGFKKALVSNVKVDVGVPSTVDAALAVGDIEQVVQITSGAEVLQTQTATIGTNIEGRQIVETPIQSRDALDLITKLPGTNTVGTVRTSSINGLPKGAINISIDGVDVQDNLLRSSDGFFTYVRPRIDAIDEVTVSSSNPGAESSGDGAIQIKFVTRRGTNDYGGGLYWQHRDEGLNANYWLNNRNGLPRGKIRLNQFGGKFGGPIPFLNFGDGSDDLFNSGKDKAFFFVNYEQYRLPEQSPTRQRTILTSQAQSGLFRYISGGQVREVNLYDLAAANGLPNTPDPTVAALFSRIRTSTGTTGTITPITSAGAISDFNREFFNFVNNDNQVRKFLAMRFDVNLTSDHSVEFVYNKQQFRSKSDFLNNADQAFPDFVNAGAQNSNRYSNSVALRSNFGESVVNEARFTRLYGNSGFSLIGGPEFFANTQGGYSFNLAGAGTILVSNATARNTASDRTSPTYDFTDALTWIKGSHSLTFGGQYKLTKTLDTTSNQVAPVVTFGVPDGDDGLDIFTTANFQGASAGQLAEAANLYASLTGRISGLTSNIFLTDAGVYVPQAPQSQNVSQRTFGFFAQDTWRFRPNLTFTFGLRWQPQEAVRLNSQNFGVLTNFDMIYDISGPGNIFTRSATNAPIPTVTGNSAGQKAYADDYNNFGPNFGVVWSPDFGDTGFLRRVFGGTGQSVIRGGFARSFVREGTVVTQGALSALNPGGAISGSRNAGSGNLMFGTLFRTTGNINLTPDQPFTTPSYPLELTINDAAAAIDPNLKTGYVDSFSFGYQRELDKNTVIEVRYVGNRGKDLVRLYLQNETNTIENGFASEFALAQANLVANRAAGRGNTFAFTGIPGTSPLPIFFSYLNGAGNPNLSTSYTGTGYTNNALVNSIALTNPNIVGFTTSAANLLISTDARHQNARNAGRPDNFFDNCPTTGGFCFLTDNSENSWYDSAVVEFRRRLTSGLRVQASYVFAKAFTDAYASPSGLAAAAATNDQFSASSVTLRDRSLDKSPAQIDIRHAFKFDATYDLPFGKGREFFGNANWVINALIGGFSIIPSLRWQSGAPILFENVQLVGMTVKDLQKEIKVRKNSTNVTYLPDDIILNTQRAFNTAATTATGYGTLFGGAPTGRFLAPAGFGNCQAKFVGDCGFRKLVLQGPGFFKLDATAIKRFAIDERRNIELRVTAFDVLNRTNWRVGGWTANSGNVTAFAGTFGQLGNGTAYQDPNGSNDPGGRILDLSLRINF
ncbi:MAG: TonB-dependent receptor [Saprospiraceae bacterium]|nr:TonB-dependent receptor [Pyrinomonadaceae bacterium]